MLCYLKIDFYYFQVDYCIVMDYMSQRLMIYFVEHEIMGKMSTSQSSDEWDAVFEYGVDMTLGLTALELGH